MRFYKKVLLLVLVSLLASSSYAAATSDSSTASSYSSQSKADNATKVDINTANVSEFTSLKGIGAKKAEAIVEYRKTHGNFAAIEDLMKVKGISKRLLDLNSARLTLGKK